MTETILEKVLALGMSKAISLWVLTSLQVLEHKAKKRMV